jgi:hypothetical protein
MALDKETTDSEVTPLKTEFKYIHRNRDMNFNPFRASESKFLNGRRLDSFPNYVVDGMRLPHVVPRITIKLRKRTACPNDWLKSPESTGLKNKSVEETTPKSRSTRKRRKFSDDGSSPKIFQFFKFTQAIISEH